MADLVFHHAAMNAGKSTLLLQAAHNYRMRGMATLLLTARLDARAGEGVIASRIGLSAPAETFGPDTDLFAAIAERTARAPLACVLVDEAQFLSEPQVWQLARAVDELGVPVLCYGLRTDFRGRPFPGSAALLAIADALREVRAVCHCGRPAIMTARRDEAGRVLTEGDQIQVGGDEAYVALCRRHWREATGGPGAWMPPAGV